MDSKLIKNDDLSIFARIRVFFTNIFHKNNSINTKEIIQENYDKQQSAIGFEKNIKVDVSKVDTKERDLREFIKQIENNPAIIENLSNERLDKLINYYEDITNLKQRKIERLKASIS